MGSTPGSKPANKTSLVTPKPPSTLHVTMAWLPAGQILHRVHLEQYCANQFNPGTQGNARFSPIQDTNGQPVPTLYAGTTMECAMMETIFHDVPHTPGFKSFDKENLAKQMHSRIELLHPLQVIDLASVALRKLGIMRNQLIDTEKDQYPATRLWAEALHKQFPEAQGLSWISRQDDSARAVMLFGDRIPEKFLQPQGASSCLLKDERTYNAVLDLADRLGVAIITGIIQQKRVRHI